MCIIFGQHARLLELQSSILMPEWHLCKAGGAVVSGGQGQTKRSPAVGVTERGVQTHSSSKHLCLLHCTMMQPDISLHQNFVLVTLWYGTHFTANASDRVVLEVEQGQTKKSPAVSVTES